MLFKLSTNKSFRSSVLRVRRNNTKAIIQAPKPLKSSRQVLTNLRETVKLQGRKSDISLFESYCALRKSQLWRLCSDWNANINWHTEGSFVFMECFALLLFLCSLTYCTEMFWVLGETLTHQPEFWVEACEDGQLIWFFWELICNSAFAPVLLNRRIRREAQRAK